MNDANSSIYFTIFVVAGIVILAWLVSKIFFLITLQNTLKLIKPQNRRMTPGEVWLLLIPLFSLVWNFVVVNRLSESIYNENADQKFSFEDGAYGNSFADVADRPTRSIGLAFAICAATSWIPLIGYFTGVAGFICWIIYWVEVNKCRRSLAQQGWVAQASGPVPGHFDAF